MRKLGESDAETKGGRSINSNATTKIWSGRVFMHCRWCCSCGREVSAFNVAAASKLDVVLEKEASGEVVVTTLSRETIKTGMLCYSCLLAHPAASANNQVGWSHSRITALPPPCPANFFFKQVGWTCSGPSPVWGNGQTGGGGVEAHVKTKPKWRQKIRLSFSLGKTWAQHLFGLSILYVTQEHLG